MYGQVWLSNEKYERINTSNFPHNHWLTGWKYSCRTTFRWRLDYFLWLCTGGMTKNKLDDAFVGNQFSIIVQWNSTQCTFHRKWKLLLCLILFQTAFIYIDFKTLYAYPCHTWIYRPNNKEKTLYQNKAILQRTPDVWKAQSEHQFEIKFFSQRDISHPQTSSFSIMEQVIITLWW